MQDRKPPRAHGGEREVLRVLLQFQRESFLRKVDGVDESEARRSPVRSGTSLLWLTKHLALAERLWILQRFAGRDVAVDDTVTETDTLAAAIADYREAWREVDEVIDKADFDATIADPAGGDASVNVRWIVSHLLEEVARHAGHADILRELIDGDTGR